MNMITFTEHERFSKRKNAAELYMVSLRGFKSAFYNDRGEAENDYCYLKKYFSGASMVKVNFNRILKNMYLNRNI